MYPEGDLPEPEPERDQQVAGMIHAIAPRVARMAEHFLDRLRRRRGRLLLHVPRMGEIEVHRAFMTWAARNHRFIMGGVLYWYLLQNHPMFQIQFLHDPTAAYKEIMEDVLASGREHTVDEVRIIIRYLRAVESHSIFETQ